ncbi:phosphatase PAP2 family protein [Stieleria sp. TO1_6]|uniref:phosphatase PAP2 family protein n=1 Tax=Stieleria tagensis TaxID=2956795 RepID=UPI00209B2DE1|nr:phosphatase PAP2 family protein [Stieleria tagensis]MCO8120608.1 phosphatase PAP2 family protein [Stieleria tagensis]
MTSHSFQKLRDWISVSIRFLRGREPIMMAGLLVVVLGTWGFIELADEVIEGSTGDFDRWAVEKMRDPDEPSRPIGPPWMASIGRDLTALGGVAVLTLVIIASAGFLVVNRSYRTMVVLVLSTTTGITASMLLKHFFSRPRPDVVPHLDQVYTSSFPSGHSMMSALVYLTLGALIAPVLQRFWLRFYVLTLAIVITGLIGVSRVYMGVHYPTDVLAGWAAGLVWAIGCWLIARQTV